MKNNFSSLLSALFILVILYWIQFTSMPQWVSNNEALSDFSSQRALEQIKIISEKPHYVGSENHDSVANYLEKELKNLGLETLIQEGNSITDWGKFS